jgi:hypothetical protein
LRSRGRGDGLHGGRRGHVWFGDASCGTGVGPIGCLFVGRNSTTLVNTDAIWDFFARRALDD